MKPLFNNPDAVKLNESPFNLLLNNDQEYTLELYLKSIGVDMNTVYINFDDERNSDSFKVTFVRDNVKESFDFYMGVGHRVDRRINLKEDRAMAEKLGITLPKLSPIDKETPRKYLLFSNERRLTLHDEQKRILNLRVVHPNKASVLYSLVLDSQAEDQPFSDWCDNYGYDNDSIKAQGIYHACIKNARKLRALLTPLEIEIVARILEDY